MLTLGSVRDTIVTMTMVSMVVVCKRQRLMSRGDTSVCPMAPLLLRTGRSHDYEAMQPTMAHNGIIGTMLLQGKRPRVPMGGVYSTATKHC